MKKSMYIGASIAITAGIVLSGCTTAGDKTSDHPYAKMSSEELAEYLLLETNSFKVDMAAQEGGKAGDRLVQDDIQKMCTTPGGEPVDAEILGKVAAMARETIKYPEGGIKLGNWEIGRDIAWSGYGYRIGHRNDDHSTRANGPGGNCYNCHQLATDRTGGTLGPPLTNYGKLRGNSEAMLKYTYEVIYNPHSYFACTNMPRMGAKNLLTEEQISHVMAYLFDPESPVNK
jgi:sulfur-oxidizing protein SoxX